MTDLRIRYIREAVERLPADDVLRMMDPDCDYDLERQSHEALDAGCFTDEVAAAVNKSRAHRIDAARAALIAKLTEMDS